MYSALEWKKRAVAVASEMGVARGWIYAIWAHHMSTGKIPGFKSPSRSPARPSLSIREKWLTAYLDDSSRCITGFGVFEEATSDNSVLVLQTAIERFGASAQI